MDEFHPFASRGASLSRSAFRDHPHPSDETARCLPIPIWASDLLPFSEMKLFYIALKLEKYFTLNGALCGDHYEWMDGWFGRQEDRWRLSPSTWNSCAKTSSSWFPWLIIRPRNFCLGIWYCPLYSPASTVESETGDYVLQLAKYFRHRSSLVGHLSLRCNCLLFGKLIEKMVALFDVKLR